IPPALEPGDRTRTVATVRPRSRQEGRLALQGTKNAIGAGGRDLPEPELLILDEPTSGLDPIVRREFIRTVIGAYQSAGGTPRTIFVSTHLISEFEGLIDEFTIIEQGRELLTMTADAARERFRKVQVRFPNEPPRLDLSSALRVRQEGREMELLLNGSADRLLELLRANSAEIVRSESLSLEEIFLVSGALPRN